MGKRVFGTGAKLGAVLGALIGGYRIMTTSTTGFGDLALSVVIIPLWMLIGVAVGVMAQQFLSVTLRKPMTWEQGALHKVTPTNPGRKLGGDPYWIGSWLAFFITLAVLGLLSAAVLLVYLPILLQ